jgi:phosphonate transport system substrate-binding protein
MSAFLHRLCRWPVHAAGLLALASMFCALALGPAAAYADSPATYTLGIVPQFEQRKLFAIWKPIADELARRTGLDIRLAFTLTVPEFEAALEKGTFDFVYANPYHILRVSDSQGYIPLVRDREPLHGILVVRRDSAVKSVEELAGKTLAIPSPNALGASLLLQADLNRLFHTQMRAVNVKTHSSVYLNVLNGLTDAGGGVEKTLAEQEPKIRDGLRILYTTRAMPSHPIAAHPRIRPEIRDKVKKALLDIADTAAGRALLADVPLRTPIATNLDDYVAMRKWGLETYWVESPK